MHGNSLCCQNVFEFVRKRFSFLGCNLFSLSFGQTGKRWYRKYNICSAMFPSSHKAFMNNFVSSLIALKVEEESRWETCKRNDNEKLLKEDWKQKERRIVCWVNYSTIHRTKNWKVQSIHFAVKYTYYQACDKLQLSEYSDEVVGITTPSACFENFS